MEHRWGKRQIVRLPVHLVCQPHALGIGQLIDASVSGGWIRSALLPSLYSQVELSVAASHAARARGWAPRDRLLGHVVRRGRYGFALEWTDATSDAVAVLLQGSGRSSAHSGAAARGSESAYGGQI